jgi:hypothetical protein
MSSEERWQPGKAARPVKKGGAKISTGLKKKTCMESISNPNYLGGRDQED